MHDEGQVRHSCSRELIFLVLWKNKAKHNSEYVPHEYQNEIKFNI